MPTVKNVRAGEVVRGGYVDGWLEAYKGSSTNDHLSTAVRVFLGCLVMQLGRWRSPFRAAR